MSSKHRHADSGEHDAHGHHFGLQEPGRLVGVKHKILVLSGGGEALARELEVPFLGAIPMDPAVVESGETGRPFAATAVGSPLGQAFRRIVEGVLEPALGGGGACPQ